MIRRGWQTSRRGSTGQGGADGGAFVPTSLSGLVLWLRADLGITIGTGVSAWADQSGNGNSPTQATGSKQPSTGTGQNGCAKLTFASASSQELVATNKNLFAGGSVTLAIVGRLSATGTRQAFFSNTDAAVGGVAAGATEATGTLRAFTCITQGDETGGSATTSPEVCVWNQIDAGATTLSVNGSSQAVTGAFDMKNPTVSPWLRIGSYDGAGLFLNGDVYEIIAWSRSLSASEQLRVTSYLRNRYAL